MNTAATYEEYKKTLNALELEDKKNWFANSEPALNENEKKLDAYMKRKRDELVGNKYTYDAYAPALMFNKSIADIKANDLFKNVFSSMPTGGNLHIHTSSAYNTDRFVDLLADHDDVYLYWNPNGGLTPSKYLHGKFYVLSKAPDDPMFINYSKIAEHDTYPFEESKKLITFITDELDKIEYIWDGFNDFFSRIGSVMKVRKIYTKYYEEAFKYQYDNNTDYIEIRAGVSTLLENNDAELTQCTAKIDSDAAGYTDELPESISLLFDAYQAAKNTCPDLKVKAIISPSRRISTNFDEDIKQATDIISHIQAWQKKCKDNGNDFIVGFDLVSEEDINHKTDDYAEAIIKVLSEKKLDVNFYFHDGESNWADNQNVHSAYALGTKRVGHGINIYNFPGLMDKIKSDKICLEICPISNQLLRYIKDLRIHPITEFFKRDIQCVICSDDPQIFETAGTFYDFWEVYHGSFIDLRDIKALIRNSYNFSAMTTSEKDEKIAAWETKWSTFVNNTLIKLNL